MNTITLTGRLTSDTELKHTQSGVSVCTYTLAVKRPKVKDTTDFLNVVSWRQGAEYLCNYGHKGDMVAITGALTSRKWQDANGNNRTSFEIVTDTVELLSSRQNGAGSNNTTQPQNTQKSQFNGQPVTHTQDWEEITVDDDDDLPF